MGFLDGVRVVDATRLLPGGYCTMLLSDMGAEVIKVEEPGLGDYMRATPPTKDGRSPLHATINRNKLSVGINLKDAEGKEVLRRLLRKSDVFVEGFRPGAMKRLGFSYSQVRRLNPRIVYCSISTYGQSGKLSSMPAHDINFQAMAGTLGYHPRPEAPLIQLGDMSSGAYAAMSILGALAAKKRGAYLDVPIVPSLLSLMAVPATAYLATGVPPKAGHSLVFGSTPYYALYETSDGRHMAVAAIEDRFWHNLLVALGVPGLEDKRFGTKEERAEVSRVLRRTFATRTQKEWSDILMPSETCATPVLTVGEALESDWAKDASMLTKAGGDLVLNGPVRSRPKQRGRPFTRAPELGEHTDRILASMGYPKSKVGQLKSKGAIQ